MIVAVPPALARRIHFEPGLPAGHANCSAACPMGRVIKLQAVYDEPFWRADGLAGYTNGDIPPVELTFDNSPPDGAAGVLLGFIEGADAAAWAQSTAGERRAAFLDVLAAPTATGRVHRARSSSASGRRSGGRAALRAAHGARHADTLPRRPARGGARDPLRRHGDRDLLERLHGRRGAVGRAGRARGPGGPVRLAVAGIVLAALLLVPAGAASAATPSARTCAGLRADRTVPAIVSSDPQPRAARVFAMQVKHDAAHVRTPRAFAAQGRVPAARSSSSRTARGTARTSSCSTRTRAHHARHGPARRGRARGSPAARPTPAAPARPFPCRTIALLGSLSDAYARERAYYEPPLRRR